MLYNDYTKYTGGRGMENIYAGKTKKELSDILLEFSSYKTVIQGCSTKTVDEYLLDLATFARFILAKRAGISPESEEFAEIDISSADAEFFKSVKTPEIYEFLLYAGTVRKNMWAAKARKLSAIKALYKFMTTKKNMQFENPAINIESPKPKKTLPKFLTLDESISLLQAIQNDKKSKTRLRDFAIVTLFLNCGMRLSELVGINLSDLDRELRSLRVVGKGGKERIVYLNTACKEALLEYLKWRLGVDHARLATKALFLSNRNQRISVKTVQWMVYKYLAAAGLGSRRYSVHKLRHTAATLMYQSGEVDLRVLKDILGHEQLNTTQIYTHVSNAAISEAMEKNPLANISFARQEKQKD
jgi:site-specific recombinase XerD